ncbi:MAG: hypothetical protein GXP06_11505 [Alphaproteobacteria bacterium]|nr:hypothetical protein [Alphaproteobacteria bacterium]
MICAIAIVGCGTLRAHSAISVSVAIDCAAVAQRYIHELSDQGGSEKEIADVRKSADDWQSKLEQHYGGDVDAIINVNEDLWAELNVQHERSRGFFGMADARAYEECRTFQSLSIEAEKPSAEGGK